MEGIKLACIAARHGGYGVRFTAEEAGMILDELDKLETLRGRFNDTQLELEQCRVQLAGCGVAALGYISPQLGQLVVQGDYGWSQSYQDVLVMRQKYDVLIENNAKLETEVTYLREKLAMARVIIKTAIRLTEQGDPDYLYLIDTLAKLDFHPSEVDRNVPENMK